MNNTSKNKGMSSRVKALVGLHLLLLLFSMSAIFSKAAAGAEFMSLEFIALYGATLFLLFIYALGWQQVIKRLPLTVAFANKAVAIIWGIIWGVLFFGEQVSIMSACGAALVILGVIMFSIADGKEQTAQQKAEREQA